MKEIIKGRKRFFVVNSDAPGIKDFWIQVEKDRWERNTYLLFDRFLDRNYSYIDIGAWVGPTALYGCQLAKHCYAIEPDLVAFNSLIHNLSLNHDIKNRITLYNICIGASTGTARLGSRTQFGDSMSSVLFTNSPDCININTLTFDDFISINRIRNINFIKIDIEGAEAEVLPTMKDYMDKNRPVLFVSFHPYLFDDRRGYSIRMTEVLKIYKHIFDTDGKALTLSTLFDILLSTERRNFSVIATDRWNYYSRLIFIFKNRKQRFGYYFRRPLLIPGALMRKFANCSVMDKYVQ